MIVQTIVRGWIIFFGIAFILIGFVIVKEGGFHAPKPFVASASDTTTLDQATLSPDHTAAEVAANGATNQADPTPAETSATDPTHESTTLPDSANTRNQESPTHFETILPPINEFIDLGDPNAPANANPGADLAPNLTEAAPVATAIAKPSPCKLLSTTPSSAQQQFDEATNVYTIQLEPGATVTVPFPAKIVKVAQLTTSGHTLWLASLDGSRALMLGGFSADLQTLRMQLPLNCGNLLAPLKEDKLYLQLRDTSGKEWWEGEVIDPAELF